MGCWCDSPVEYWDWYATGHQTAQAESRTASVGSRDHSAQRPVTLDVATAVFQCSNCQKMKVECAREGMEQAPGIISDDVRKVQERRCFNTDMLDGGRRHFNKQATHTQLSLNLLLQSPIEKSGRRNE